MQQTVIITSKHYKSVCSVVCGTQDQINAVLRYDPQAHGFKAYSPSDWDYRGEVLSLFDEMPCNVCRDILQGKASLPSDLKWMI